MKYDKIEMQKHFNELTEKADKIKAKVAPLKEERDAFVQKARADEQAMIDKIRKAEEGLFDIEMERATIARALGARTLEVR